MPEHEVKHQVDGYNPQNPPPNLDAAYAQIWERQEQAEHINAQLEHTSPEEYPTDNEFFAWKGRAISALAHTRAEVRFLGHWIDEQKFAQNLKEFSAVQWSAPFQIGATIERLVAEMRARYQPTYSETVLPIDRASAYGRRSEIKIIITRFQGFFSGVKMLMTAANIGGDAEKNLLSPMVSIMRAVELEASILRKYLRATDGEDLVLFLISLLDRAMSEGFVPNSEEDRFLNRIRELKRNESKDYT